MKTALTLLSVFALASMSLWGSACANSDNVLQGPGIPLGNGPSTGTSNFSCTIDGLTFSNFEYNLNSGLFSSPNPQINLLGPGLVAGVVQFNFNPNLFIGSDLEFEFKITGGINSAHLDINGGTGSFINERLCPFHMSINDGTCFSGVDQTIGGRLLTVTGSPTTVDDLSFPSASPVWVFKDINSGSSGVSEVSQSYGIPEPMTLSLMGAGLLGLGLLGRRLRK